MDKTLCKVCGTSTSNTGTKLCNLCWEIDSRLSYLSDKAVTYFLGRLHAIKKKHNKVKETS